MAKNPTFRASTTMVKGTAANATGTVPAGVVKGDILVALLQIQAAAAPTVTPPAGWSDDFGGTQLVATCVLAGQEFKQYAYWIRRGDASPALTWTFGSAFRELVILAFQDANTIDNPFSFGAIATRDDATALTYPSISGNTKNDNELLIWLGGNWQGGTSGTQPTGFTERIDSNGNASCIEIADKVQAVAGASGSVTGASYGGAANGTVACFLAALRSDTTPAGNNFQAVKAGSGISVSERIR